MSKIGSLVLKLLLMIVWLCCTWKQISFEASQAANNKNDDEPDARDGPRVSLGQIILSKLL